MDAAAPKYINIKGELFDLSQPAVMGIVNVTPDSFFDGSRAQTEAEILLRTQTLIEQGSTIIDLGAYSDRKSVV